METEIGTKRKFKEIEEDNDECVVCKESFEKSKLFTMVPDCKHPMCKECIAKNRRLHCDLCNRDWKRKMIFHDATTCEEKCGQTFAAMTWAGAVLINGRKSVWEESGRKYEFKDCGKFKCLPRLVHYAYDKDKELCEKVKLYVHPIDVSEMKLSDGSIVLFKTRLFQNLNTFNVAIIQKGSVYTCKVNPDGNVHSWAVPSLDSIGAIPLKNLAELIERFKEMELIENK